MDLALLIARLALALVLAAAAAAKLLDVRGAREAMRAFGAPASMAPALAVLVPPAELAVAVLLVPASTAAPAAAAGLVLLAAFTVAAGANLARGRAPECNCFGVLSRGPVGPRTLVRNGVLMALAAFVAIVGWGGAGDSLPRWVSGLGPAGRVGLALGVALAGIFGYFAWYARTNPVSDEWPPTRAEASFDDHDDDDESAGLALGEPAPAFTLMDVVGGEVTLDVLRRPGLPTLLVFADPTCGSCLALLPDVARWQRELAGELTVVVVTSGDRERNRLEAEAQGLKAMVVQTAREVANAYRIGATPAAVVVGTAGGIASEVMQGADEIHLLVDRELWRLRPVSDA